MAKRPPTVARVARALAADPTTLSDRDLLARFVADNDQAAFAAVAARHTGMVLGVCRRALSRAADAEDACQAVFLMLAEKAARIRWQGSVAGWLYTVARRVARNARLSAERRARRESKAAVPESVAPVDTMTGRELAAILDEELGRLAPRYRDPLVLCCLEGLTQDEAATRLGVRLETLRSQLKRGRKKLADALASRGCDLGIALLAVTASAASAAPQLVKSIQAVAAGSPTPVAIALARGSVVKPLFTPKSMMLAATVVAAALGLAAATVPPTSAQPPKAGVKPAVEKADAPVVARFGGDRFRASAPIGDAHYSPDGKRIVGHAGGTIYVWDAVDGSVVRTIDTKLGGVPDPPWPYERDRPFAVHPKEARVAIAGIRGDKTVLQLWDYVTGERVAELDALKAQAVKVLAWTPDGTRLLERSNESWIIKGGKVPGRLIVRNPNLQELRSPQVAMATSGWGAVLLPLPNSKQAIVWQSPLEPVVYDLDTGNVVRMVGYKTQGLSSGLALSPDGTTLAVTCTEKMALVDFASGEVRHFLPVRRGGWEMPRPLFSPDGRTIYVFDFGPRAFDVATGKEKWTGVFPTVHSFGVRPCGQSPDGSTLLCTNGHWIARLDTATGLERDPPAGPSRPAGITWSPDGKRLFTRVTRSERTWTAWDVATGKRLYHLEPTGFVPDNEWKVKQELFFIHGGKEIVAVVEKAERNERSAGKELLVFDITTGKCLRRLGGGPLPTEQFRWLIPVSVEPDGSSAVFQNYTVSSPFGPGGAAAGGARPDRHQPRIHVRHDALGPDPPAGAQGVGRHRQPDGRRTALRPLLGDPGGRAPGLEQPAAEARSGPRPAVLAGRRPARPSIGDRVLRRRRRPGARELPAHHRVRQPVHHPRADHELLAESPVRLRRMGAAQPAGRSRVRARQAGDGRPRPARAVRVARPRRRVGRSPRAVRVEEGGGDGDRPGPAREVRVLARRRPAGRVAGGHVDRRLGHGPVAESDQRGTGEVGAG